MPYLQWLCLAGLLYPLHAINLNVINVKGRSDIFLKLEVVKKVMIVLAILGGLPWAVKGLVIGQVIVSFLAYFLNSFFSLRLIGYSIKEQVMDVFPYILLATFMGFLVWLLGYSFWRTNVSGWNLEQGMFKTTLVLGLQVTLGIGFYLFSAWRFKLDALKQLLNLFRLVSKK